MMGLSRDRPVPAPAGSPAHRAETGDPAPSPFAPAVPRLGAGRPRLGGRGLLTLLLVAAVALSFASVDWRAPLVHAGGWAMLGGIVAAAARPALSAELLRVALAESWRTLAYAAAGWSLAVALAFPLGVVASGVLVRRPALRIATSAPVRTLLGLLRAIHELVWALLFVAAVGLSPFAAVLALALPYAGILGRILADMLNDVPDASLAALRAAGAGEGKALVYGRLPIAVPNMVGYALYRFECGLRSAAIMSFVGLGGLGYQIQISLDDLRFDEVWTFVCCLVLMVVLFDWWSGFVRRRLVA